jgi:hypothetical protein
VGTPNDDVPSVCDQNSATGPGIHAGGSERMVGTRVTSRSMRAILLFEVVVSGCGG